MCITAYASNTLKPEIEEFGLETCFLEEGDEKGAETAVDVKGNFALYGQF